MAELTLTCNCGAKVAAENAKLVQAKMWYHQIQEHPELLNKMTIQELDELIGGWDNQLSDQS